MFEDLFSRSGISLDRLRSFLALAEAGSIAQAAPGNASQQSQISRQIRELETFFDCELTLRRGKTLVLSTAGQRLASLIRSQLQDLDDFRLEQQGLPKRFRIGAGSSVLEWVIVPALAGIRQVLSGAALAISSHRSHDLVEGVRNGRLDWVVVREDAIPRERRLGASLPVLRMSFHLCVPRKLLGRRPLSALDDPSFLARLPFAALGSGGQLDHTFRMAMQRLTGAFHPAVECDSMLQVHALIVRGECAALVPSVALQGFAKDAVAAREFSAMRDYARTLVLHWNQRQMIRRGVEESSVRELALQLSKDIRPTW